MDGACRIVELVEQAAGRVIDASGDLAAGLVDIGREAIAGAVDLIDIILDDAFEPFGHAGAAGLDEVDEPGARCADRGRGCIGRRGQAFDQRAAILFDADMDVAGGFVELCEQAAGRIIQSGSELLAGLLDESR